MSKLTGAYIINSKENKIQYLLWSVIDAADEASYICTLIWANKKTPWCIFVYKKGH